MALQVQGSFELENGLQLTEVYVRTNANLSIQGDRVDAHPTFWIDSQAYIDDKTNIDFYILANFSYVYDRAVDGADILTFANNKVKETLEELGYTATIVGL
jgi:hypothetical protein